MKEESKKPYFEVYSNKKLIKKIQPRARARVRRILRVFKKLRKESGKILLSKKLVKEMGPWNYPMLKRLKGQGLALKSNEEKFLEKDSLAKIYFENFYVQKFLDGHFFIK